MFKLIEKRPDAYVIISEGNLFFQGKNRIDQMDNELKISKSINKNKFYYYLIPFKDGTYFGCNLESIELLDFERETTLGSWNYIFIAKNNDNCIVHESDVFPCKLMAFETRSLFENKVWSNDYLVSSWNEYDEKKLYFETKSLSDYEPIGKISAMEIDTGAVKWVFDILQFGLDMKVSRLVGIWNGILVAGIGEDYMIGINTENGELVWKRKAIPDFDIIDQSYGVLHSLTSGYVKTDIRTGKTLDIFDKKEYFEEEIGIESQRNNYVLVGDHIITSDWKKGKLGAFNTITHRFDWIHEEPGVSFPAGQAMKYFDPYLFVMDSKEVLHIFKKE